MMKHIKTSRQRVGLVLMVISLVMWLMTALHWNFVEKPFFSQVPKVSYEQGSEPAGKPGMKWFADETAWRLIDQECMTRMETAKDWPTREKRALAKLMRSPWPADCIKESKAYASHYYTESHYSFGDYASNLVNSWGDYFWLNITAFLLLFIGIIMFSGVDVRLWKWIKTGR